jgi:hypothetical protein
MLSAEECWSSSIGAVREAAHARDESLRTVLGEYLGKVRRAIRRTLDSMRSERGGS